MKTFLNFAKPGRVERVAVAEVVEMARELAQYRIRFEEIEYEAVVEESVGEVEGNKNQLVEVLFNLLANAYDATELKRRQVEEGRWSVGGGRYVGRVRVAVVGVRREGAEWVQVTVEDNGIGIKEEDLPRLFVPFFTTKATSEKGSGLGLYVIRRIMEHHGGKVEVRSVYGQGTTVTLLLPVAGRG